MKVPKHIRTALWEAQKYFRLAIREGNIVRDWMKEVGLVNDNFEPTINRSNIADSYIDTIEYDISDIDGLIKELEKELEILKGGRKYEN